MSKRSEIDTPLNVTMAALFCAGCFVFFYFGMAHIYRERPAEAPPAEVIYADDNAFIIERSVESPGGGERD